MHHLPAPGPLLIVGAGGFGRECLDVVESLNALGAGIEFGGFVDDGPVELELLERRGVEWIGTIEAVLDGGRRFVVAIGDGRVRRSIIERTAHVGGSSPVLVHPDATIGSACRIGDGTILNAGARATTNITMGRHVQLHANCSVGHDAELGDYVSVFPGATISGAVVLGEAVTVGTGANVLPGIEVGAGAYVGAGAVVTTDVPADATVVGVPARPLPRR